ncbi:hypothetical protein Q8A67_017325 [Cirrhinus molitorella]|uniref:Uncharacterized protein n=1 Tax=Cirrhinus molitorella TaxID=172907 RepID=A0AA88TGX6_9TELE|nr:hypothetical protein Q8A67_017325 [Cirrhinus molitorella]
MKGEKTKDPTPLLIEVKPQPTPPADEIKTLAGSSLIKSSVKKTLAAKRASRHLPPLATETRHPSSGEKTLLVRRISQGKPLPGSSFIKSSVEEPPLSVTNSAPKATETKPLHGSIAIEPKMAQRASRHLPPPAKEPLQVVSQMEQVMVSPRQVPKCAEVKLKSATSSFILIDIDEFVEHTERTTPLSESEKAGVKQKAVFEKVHPIVLEQSNDFGKKKCADSKAEALRKAKELDEQMMRLFCVDYSPGPKKENQQHLKSQRKPKNNETGMRQKVCVLSRARPGEDVLE